MNHEDLTKRDLYPSWQEVQFFTQIHVHSYVIALLDFSVRFSWFASAGCFSWPYGDPYEQFAVFMALWAASCELCVPVKSCGAVCGVHFIVF